MSHAFVEFFQFLHLDFTFVFFFFITSELYGADAFAVITTECRHVWKPVECTTLSLREFFFIAWHTHTHARAGSPLAGTQMRIFPTRSFGPAPFVERFLSKWRMHDAPHRNATQRNATQRLFAPRRNGRFYLTLNFQLYFFHMHNI